MTQLTRKTDWSQLPYEARVAINGPTTAVYSVENLPSNDDPGWSSWSKDGKTLRMINIHGPFAVRGHQDSERCEDGWLGIDDSGFIFAVESEYFRPVGGSELDERARPLGYSAPS